jgi:hypothetical protein
MPSGDGSIVALRPRRLSPGLVGLYSLCLGHHVLGMPMFESGSHTFAVFIYSSNTTQDEGNLVSIRHMSGQGQPMKDNIFNLT